MDSAPTGEGIQVQNPQVSSLTIAQLGRLVGYSTQQVRDLERLRGLDVAAGGELHVLLGSLSRTVYRSLAEIPTASTP